MTTRSYDEAEIQRVKSTDGDPAWTMYSQQHRWGMLAVLFLVSTSNYLDRSIIAALLEPIKQEFHVSDTLLGLLSGFSFAAFYAVFGLPVAQWADRGNRRTVITVALTVWSIMTVLCGYARGFWHLALARVGVGAGESGAVPPAQSLIADYFPLEQRTAALAIFNSAATAGYLLGIGAGGYIAATHGWRIAFICAGVPGLLLAGLTRLTLREPRLQRGFAYRGGPHEGVWGALAGLWRKKSFRYALLGSLFGSLYSYGEVVFLPAFQVRVLHAPLTEVSERYGTSMAAAGLIGTLAYGWLADRLGRSDIRWIAWLAAAGSAAGGLIYIFAMLARDLTEFLLLGFAANVLIAGGTGVYAAIHAVCGSRRRAMAIAVVLFLGTIVGGGLGPFIVGAMSDALSSTYGLQGLRYSLLSIAPTLVACGIFFALLGMQMPVDLEE